MEDKFDSIVEVDKITIFGYASEVETQLAIEMFEANATEYVLYDLEVEADAKDVLTLLEKRLGVNNTPLFYYSGSFIGDYIDMKSMDNERKNSKDEAGLDSEASIGSDLLNVQKIKLSPYHGDHNNNDIMLEVGEGGIHCDQVN